MAVNLLGNLIQRLRDASGGSSESAWYPIFHERLLLQTLLSRVHHSLRTCGGKEDPAAASAAAEVVHGVLGVLLLIARSGKGCCSLLASGDLPQMLWLPLAGVRLSAGKEEWLPVFKVALQLATVMLRQAKHEALENRLVLLYHKIHLQR